MFCVSTNLPTGTKHRCVTWDAGNYCFQREVRDAIAACAGLDTRWGVAAMQRAYDWQGDEPCTIKVGSFTVVAYQLDMSTGERVGEAA